MTPKKRNKPADDLINTLMNDLKNEAAGDATALLPPDSPNEISGEGSAVSDKSSSITVDDRTKPFGAGNSQKETSPQSEPEAKVSFGIAKPSMKSGGPDAVHSSVDAQIQQAETLRLAQKRILELEKHLEKLRAENEQFSSIADLAKEREEDLLMRVQSLEKSKAELRDHSHQEISIFRDNLQSKEYEGTRLKMRIEELESRLQADLKKIRVRERELENRLELAKLEKNALLKAKDENILDLKRRMDQVMTELATYKDKCVELNRKIEMNNEQFSRTVRALRLALTNLESNEQTSSISLTALKKAE